MSAWRIIGALLAAAAALISASAGAAKDFEPGDLRVCNATRCVSISDRGTLRAFSAFLYGERRVRIAPRVRPGAPSFKLRFRGGHLAAVVGPAKLNRVLVNGLNCGRFRRGSWYRLPARAAREVRRLTAALDPVQFSRRAVPRSC